MKELIRGKYDLTQENWVIGEEKWDVVYDVVEKGKAITKRIQLHPNNYHLAKVDETCSFYIQSVQYGNELIDMAVIEETNLKINSHLFDNISVSGIVDEFIGKNYHKDIDGLLIELKKSVNLLEKEFSSEGARIVLILEEAIKQLKNGK